MPDTPTALETEVPTANSTNYTVLAMISLGHLLNDSIQSLLVPSYPLFRDNFHLSFTQIGILTLTYNLTASLLQPLVGRYTDRHPRPYSLPVGMILSLSGLLFLAIAPSYNILLVGASLLGMGSSIFHPESSRVTRQAAGGRFGLAQSIFQVGGNTGSSIGPLLAAAVIIPHGQISIAYFAFIPLLGATVLLRVGAWSKKFLQATLVRPSQRIPPRVSRKTLGLTFAVLLFLIFSKYFYVASISSYLIFYLTDKFGIGVQEAQMRLFIFLAAMAVGTLIGGPVGDRIGRKNVIWVSILGVAPFTLALPYVDLAWTGVLIAIIGLILASAFPAIVVFAQELIPGRVGTVAGLFFGLSFGIGGIGAAVLGRLADLHGIDSVYHACSYLPLLGILTIFLPNLREAKPATVKV
ncbi:MAG: MFS transporter [Planctomycetota bacterium]|jgi:FSR family fosmidomycin resistance protein-like MFS transporter|nr:MFS transporter [Planctomycetota bacterium]